MHRRPDSKRTKAPIIPRLIRPFPDYYVGEGPSTARFRLTAHRTEGDSLLCSNGHQCPENVAFCPTCGVAFGTPAPMSVGMPPPMAQVTYVQQIQTTSTNGLAIASMVLGIGWVWWIGSILALVFGFVARKQIRERGQRGDGMAIAGIVLGCVGAATLLLFIILFAAGTHTSTNIGN